MKTLKITTLILTTTLFLLSSCSKDPMEELPGTWNTSDGGTITFNTDGTGSTIDSEFFLEDCGTITTNGVTQYIGPVTDFEWMITDGGSKDNLFMTYTDTTSYIIDCIRSREFPVTMKGKDKAVVGVSALGLSLEVELTR